MSEKIVQLNEEIIKGQLKELVRGSVEETLNELLEKEAESLTQAARYERSVSFYPRPVFCPFPRHISKCEILFSAAMISWAKCSYFFVVSMLSCPIKILRSYTSVFPVWRTWSIQ